MTYEEFINLKPGDKVEVKPYWQIQHEYGSYENIPGISFTESMLMYCGQTLTVKRNDGDYIVCEEANRPEYGDLYWLFSKDMLNLIESTPINLDAEWVNMIFIGIEDK